MVSYALRAKQIAYNKGRFYKVVLSSVRGTESLARKWLSPLAAVALGV